MTWFEIGLTIGLVMLLVELRQIIEILGDIRTSINQVRNKVIPLV